jgi:Ca2+-binding EF-hand superfamily protein
MVAKGGEFTALDTNKDGKLSQGEMPKNHRLAPHFDMLDVNRDGTLSAAEFAAGQQM